MSQYLHVTNEVGRLRRVLLHRPGIEVDRLIPRHLGDMLFEDLPWLEQMREEHDAFASLLRANGVEVVYLDELLQTAFAQPGAARAFAEEVLEKEILRGSEEIAALCARFLSASPAEQTTFAIAGVAPESWLPIGTRERLSDHLPLEADYLLPPLPNLYFMRDPAAVIGSGIALSSMNTQARRREARLMRFLLTHHPAFASTPLFYDNATSHMPLEGGDVLNLSPSTVVIGSSQRTSIHAIDYLAHRLLFSDTTCRHVLVVAIPQERAYMHLDTVMTMFDRDSFIVYPQVMRNMALVEITAGAHGRLCYTHHESLAKALASLLHLPAVRLLETGGGDEGIAAREQWNDASNTLAIAPGKVIVYQRNTISNQCLRAHGCETLEIAGSELVRGRGGPHCMSLALWRDDLD